MPGIFISYRRQDTRAEARAIYERLSRDLPGERIFIDLEGIDYGVDFSRVIDEQLKQCQVALVLIGERWLEVGPVSAGAGRRRIDDENDFVRLETRAVLQRDIRVVPVLVGDARLPSSDELPEDLRPLLRRNKFDLDFETFDADMGRLVASLKRMAADASAKPGAPPSPAPEMASPPPPTAKSEPHTSTAPAPRKPRPRAAPIAPAEREPAVASKPAPIPPAAQAPVPPRPEPWWQSTLSKVASGAAVVAFLGYQAWHNGWWKSDQPASSGVVVGQPSSSVSGPAAATIASAVRLGTPVVVVNTSAAPASTPAAAPPPARVAYVALGRPISISAAAEQGRPSLTVARPAREPAAAMAPLTRFRDCDSDVCPWMIVLPAGSFLMGSPADEPERQEREGPQHRVQVPAFAAGQYEITFEQWDACVAASGCSHKPAAEGWGRGKRPVINVSWQDAQGYARWLSTKTGRSYRLLSEAEWEYAARAGTSTPFAFGQQITTAQANFNGNYTYNGSAKGEYREKTLPVGSLAANAWQLYDMHGNVWAWVADCWHDSYASAPADGSAWTIGCKEDRRVLRGGGWDINPRISRSAFRIRDSPDIRSNYGGFRLARTLLVP